MNQMVNVTGRIGGLVVALSAACAVGCGGPEHVPAPRVASPPALAIQTTLSPRDIAARAMASVVAIKGARGIGSGFVIDPAGLVATNLHVLTAIPDAQVVLSDDKQFPPLDVVAIDETHDLAIIRIRAAKLKALPLGDSKRLDIGDPVVAMGNPLGLERTVSDGLLSGVREKGEFRVLQISAPIAPGSSGGPLLNERGEVVGIATAVVKNGQNLGFAVPVEYLKKALDEKKGAMSFAELGARVRAARAPEIPRDVPRHELGMLNGCDDGELGRLYAALQETLEAGAQLYDAERFVALAHLFDGASNAIERDLGARCFGPRRELHTGRIKARQKAESRERLWALRDSFEGLINVIELRFAPARATRQTPAPADGDAPPRRIRRTL